MYSSNKIFMKQAHSVTLVDMRSPTLLGALNHRAWTVSESSLLRSGVC
jgi:hypothetical protein